MLEKIKKALGEELTAQVETAMKTANLDLAVSNDGTVVPVEKFRNVETKLKGEQTTNTTLKADMETLKNTATQKGEEDTTVQEKMDALQGKFDDYVTKTESDKVTSSQSNAYEKRLRAEKMNPDSIEDALGNADYSKIFNDEGTINDDYIEKYKTSRSSLFGVEQMNSQQTTNTQTREKPKFTMEQMKNMSPQQVRANMKDIKASLSQ